VDQTRARIALRRGLVRLSARRDPRLRPWSGVDADVPRPYIALCNVCGWHGEDFEGPRHSERATCPHCGSIARDRFLHHCFQARTRYRRDLRVLETSPRLGDEYRTVMRERVDYLCSDFDLRAHRADLQVDLQDMELPDESLDVVLTSHVLEHVPDTDRALKELFRVLRPGGHLVLLVPITQGKTAPPAEPEYHSDDTLVYWRFGLDLTERLRGAGFRTTVLVPADFRRRAATGDAAYELEYRECDIPAIVAAADPADLTVVASDRTARRLAFEPSYMFIAWEGVKPR
jgi:SAM-dependent methyltransferase